MYRESKEFCLGTIKSKDAYQHYTSVVYSYVAGTNAARLLKARKKFSSASTAHKGPRVRTSSTFLTYQVDIRRIVERQE